MIGRGKGRRRMRTRVDLRMAEREARDWRAQGKEQVRASAQGDAGSESAEEVWGRA